MILYDYVPKTFGLKELKEGYFPHFFNTTVNQNYIEPLLAPKFYGIDTIRECKNCYDKSSKTNCVNFGIFDFS